MMKRIFALILCMVMCLSLFPTAAFAESRVEETPAEETEELAPVGDGALDVPEDDAEAAEPVILSDSEGAQGEPNEDDASVDEGDSSPCPEEPGEAALLVEGEDGQSEAEEGSPTEPAVLSEDEETMEIEALEEEDESLLSQPDDGEDPIKAEADPESVADDMAEGVTASGSCGEQGNNLSWSLDNTGTLSISGSGRMANYDWGETPWYDYREDIRSVVIGSGVIYISTYAFLYCSSMTSVVIPASVTSIGQQAFSQCASLESVTIPEGVTSIEKETFSGCSSLTTVILPAGLRSIGRSAFSSCRGLTGIELPSTVTSIGDSAFAASGLTEIELPESVTSIDVNAFSNCTALTRIRIPSGVSSIASSTFFLCSSLVSIDIPSGVTSIGDYAFFQCTSLPSIDLPTSVSSIGPSAFYGCTSLASIELPEGLTNIGESAFLFCTALTDVYFVGSEQQRNEREGNGWSVKSNENLFNAEWHYNGRPVDVFVRDFAELKAAVQNNTGRATWVYFGGSDTFVINETITLPENFVFIAEEEDSTLLIPAGVTLTVESTASDAFSVGNLVIEGTMIAYRRAVSYSTISGTVDWLLMQLDGGDCGAQSGQVTWSFFDNGELIVTGSGAMADYICPWSAYRDDIVTVTVESGVTGIGCSSFSDCRALSCVTLPASLTSIGNGAFAGCASLMEIELPAGLTCVEENVFASCSSLTGIEIPAAVTAIGSGAFSSCSSLTDISIPAGLMSIGRYAFSGCSSLTDVFFDGSEQQRYERESAGWSAVENSNLLEAAWHYAVQPEIVVVNDFAELKAAVQNNDGSEICLVYHGSGTFVIDETITLPGNISFRADAANSTLLVPAGVALRVESTTPNAFSMENLVVEGTMAAYRRAVCCGAISGTVDWLNLMIASGECGMYGSNVTWALYEDGELRFSGSGAIADCNTNPGGWSDYSASVGTVTIGSGVTSIGGGAFAYCDRMTRVEIPASVTFIGDSAFFECAGLASVAFGGSERQRTDREGNYWSAFGNGALFEADWSYAVLPTETDVHDFAELKAAVQAFDGGELYVYYNGSDTFVIEESITLPESFFFCADNSTLLIPAGVSLTVNSTVTNAFSVENLTVEGTMTAYRRAVYYRTISGRVNWLRLVVISGACGAQGDHVTWTLYEDGEMLIDGSGAMADYNQTDPGRSDAPWSGYTILRVKIGAGVTYVGRNDFYGCRNITVVELPDSLTGIGSFAFGGCSGLTVVEIPNSVTGIGEEAFSSCSGLTGISLPAALISIGDNAFGYCRSLTSITLPAAVRDIGRGAFNGCSNLASIVFPAGVTSIGDWAFNDCFRLRDVYFGGSLQRRIQREGSVWNTECNAAMFQSSVWHYNTYIEHSWYEEEGEKYYYADAGLLATGWRRIDGKWYYFNDDGVMQTGWKKISGKWYYLDDSGAMQTGLQIVDGKWYYFNDSGVMQTGWKKIDNKWYYFNDSGVMQTGWKKIGGVRYYFDESGAMQTGWKKIGDSWYYFNSSGAMQTGWNQISGKWYYLGDSGAMQTGLQTIDGSVYYFDDGGAMQTGWKQLDGDWYCFESSGAMRTGWFQSGSTWYYLAADGKMATGLREIGGKSYYFAPSGAMQTGWKQLDDDWYYFQSSGAMQTGWMQSGSTWYYLKSSGAMAVGWQKVGSTWYYFQSSGAMKTGWLKDGGKWYYLDSSGAMLANTSRSIGGKVYYFNASGVCTNP